MGGREIHQRPLIHLKDEQGIAIGWDADYSQNTDVLWLIREAEIRFLQPLRHYDEFDLTIWMVTWQKVRGTRCFELTRKESGEVIAQGTQQVVHVYAKTGRPINLPEEEIVKFRLEDPRVFPFERFPKITPAEGSFTMQRQVEWMDLDAYEHVNNVVYVNYAEETAAQDFSIRGWSPAKLSEAGLMTTTRRIQIQYLSLAVWGETLNISSHMLQTNNTGGARYVGITHADGSLVVECILDWELVDRKSGEARLLPDGLF